MNNMEKKEVPEHFHLSYVGAEYSCEICNPICYANHRGKNMGIKECPNPQCPVKALNKSKRISQS